MATFESHKSSILSVEMLGEETEGSDMICGGVSTLLVEYLSAPQLYGEVNDRLKSGIRLVLAKRIIAEDEGVSIETGCYDEAGSRLFGAAALGAKLELPAPVNKASYDRGTGIFYDLLWPDEKLLILGGGHVGLAVTRAVRDLDFEVTVVDERPIFGSQGRFAEAIRTIQKPYGAAIADFPFDQSTYVVIVTPGHLHDLECIRAVLHKDYRYVGLIGSRRKVAKLREQLLSDGYPPERVASFRAPIGLDIGAETPGEIAISIVAQLVEYRRLGSSKS